MKPLQWDLVQSFKAVAESGSLSSAARMLLKTQPTIGRHIDMLEEVLRVALFTRGREGMILTERGRDLVMSAQEMESAALSFSNKAAGYDEDISGPIRISVNDVFGIYIMPRLISALAEEQPSIQIELDINNQASNLLRRDADIAIRLFRPTQLDLVARKVADLPMGIYAHRQYNEKYGAPVDLQDLVNHRFIGFDRDPILIDAGKQMGISLTPEDFFFRTDSIVSQIEALRAGVGIGFTHVEIANQCPELIRLLPEIKLPTMELWITSHSDVRYNKRVRVVTDFLAENLKSPYQWCRF
jgi:DNA-binding transcriptional LysR family regulator